MSVDTPFQVFGSQDSTDYDVMLFVDTIPDPHSSKMLCNAADAYLTACLPLYGWDVKPLNSNLAVVTDGVVTKVFKGCLDEVNNSLIATYDLHQQQHPLMVERVLERDTDLKILRTFRVVLSFISRTQHRVAVKQALRGNLVAKLAVVRTIPFNSIRDLGKGVELIDYYKTLAFQFGQTLALLDGVELYTKQDIAQYYPLLHPFLYRVSGDVQVLQDIQDELIKRTELRIPFMTKLVE